MQEAKNLVELMKQLLTDKERFSVWMLLSEFYRMSQAFVPEIHNQILREWVAYAYYYGHHYLCQHLQSGDWYCVDNTLINDEHIDTLMTQEEPEAYPPWDGWYHPNAT